MRTTEGRLQRRQLCQMTTRLVKKFYKGEARLILLCSHPKMCWFVDGENRIYKAGELKEELYKRKTSYWVRESETRQCEIDRHFCRVEGEYCLFLTEESSWPVQKIHICASWLRQDVDWKLIELHENAIWKSKQEILRVENTERVWVFLASDEIFYIEAKGKHSLVRMQQTKLEVLQSIAELEQMTRYSLIKVHRSYLINPCYVTSVKRFEVLMPQGETIPVAEKRYTKVKQVLLEYPLTEGYPGQFV